MSDPIQFSERKMLTLGEDPQWSIEEIVAAQNMECDLVPYEEIARKLERKISDVMALLQPSEARAPARQERSNIGFAKLKGYR